MFGGDKGNRTPDLLNAIQTLYQLSYAPMALWRGLRTRRSIADCLNIITQNYGFARTFVLKMKNIVYIVFFGALYHAIRVRYRIFKIWRICKLFMRKAPLPSINIAIFNRDLEFRAQKVYQQRKRFAQMHKRFLGRRRRRRGECACGILAPCPLPQHTYAREVELV